MRRRRRALTPGERRRASQVLCRRLRNHPSYIQANTVGVYFPNDGEIDVTSLVKKDHSKKFFLPVLPPRGKRRLWFAQYVPTVTLIPDRYGIPAPVSRIKVRAEQLDLLLVPLVAFDHIGGRIGMGGGFYDASLNFLKEQKRITPTRVVGAAYHFQQVSEIPKESWDIPLHGVISDQLFIAAAAS